MKTVFITGASSGIGKATALLFAARGWNVIAGMRNPGSHDITEGQENIMTVRLDVSEENTIATAVAAGIQRFRSIDALVNCAGYGLAGVFEAAKMDQIRKQYEVNVFGLMSITQAVLPHMRRQGGGSIVNISSFGGIIALPFGSLYNSSKFAVEGFSEGLSHELVPLNIRVKIVEPGSIATNFTNNMDMINGSDPAYAPLVKSFFPRYQKLTEHLRKNSAEDVAETIYLACTDESDRMRYVSGEDAQFYIDLKQKHNEEEFVKKVREAFYES
jgi:NAD(P)-dependent dehydrogenase (short-subunit alcohol dehydrogenase family)